MDLFTKKRQTHRLRKETYGFQRGKIGERKDKWELGIDMYTSPYLKYLTNKDLLYSTGKSAQYSVIT